MLKMRRLLLLWGVLFLLPVASATFEIDSQKAQFSVQYSTQTFDVDNAVLISQSGEPFADVDYVAVEVNGKLLPPTMALLDGRDVLHKLVSQDNDVIEVNGKSLLVGFSNGGKLHLNANEYGHNAIPMRYPSYVEFATTKIASGRFAFDGRLDRALGESSLKEWWVSATGHPPGWLYGWVRGDKDYVYLAFEITPDNTDDATEDWAAVYVKTSDGIKKYFSNYENTEFGLNTFAYSSSVNYEHNFVEFRIPRGIVDSELTWYLEYYGTGAVCGNGAQEFGEQCDPGGPGGVPAPDDDNCVGLCEPNCVCGKEVAFVLQDLYIGHNMLFSKVQDLAHINKHESIQDELKMIQYGLRQAYLNPPNGDPCAVVPNLFMLTADLHPYGKENEIDNYNQYLLFKLSDVVFRGQVGVSDLQFISASTLQATAEAQLSLGNFLMSGQLKCCAYNQLIEPSLLQYDQQTGECEMAPICGNGVIEFPEECDDGNLVSGDGCNNLCEDEFCGDGITQPGLGEQCDDGNVANGDGCDEFCQTELPECGDGNLDFGEACDDGNIIACDGCSAACQLESCGDGQLCNPPEECEDGNIINGDGCSSTCTTESCGDNFLDANGADNAPGGGDDEACDDGNNAPNDGCGATCQFECGDGIINPGEECNEPALTCPGSEICNTATCLCSPPGGGNNGGGNRPSVQAGAGCCRGLVYQGGSAYAAYNCCGKQDVSAITVQLRNGDTQKINCCAEPELVQCRQYCQLDSCILPYALDTFSGRCILGAVGAAQTTQQTAKSGVEASVPAECRVDSDCAPGFRCSNGKCMQEQAPAQPNLQEESLKPRLKSTHIVTGALLLVALILLIYMVMSRRRDNGEVPEAFMQPEITEEPVSEKVEAPVKEAPKKEPKPVKVAVPKESGVDSQLDELEKSYQKIEKMLKSLKGRE